MQFNVKLQLLQKNNFVLKTTLVKDDFSKKSQFYDFEKNWFMATFLENLPTERRH